MTTRLEGTIDHTTATETWWPAVERSPRRVQVEYCDQVIAASSSPRLYLDYGPPPNLPTYYFSHDEIASDCLIDPVNRNGSTVWSVEVRGNIHHDAAWTHPNPAGELEPLGGLITFTWFGDLQWYEEAEPVFGHARDPHKRVDVLRGSRHVEVWVDDAKIAETERPMVLFETLLPTRFYLPREDVRLDLLTESKTVTRCPYKGVATHYTLPGHGDVAWSYLRPIAENPRIEGLICFYNERVDLVVDGTRLERPPTPWRS